MRRQGIALVTAVLAGVLTGGCAGRGPVSTLDELSRDADLSDLSVTCCFNASDRRQR